MGKLLLAGVLDSLVIEGDGACGSGGILGRSHEQDACGRWCRKKWLEELLVLS
jgi:hypothetical protein